MNNFVFRRLYFWKNRPRKNIKICEIEFTFVIEKMKMILNF